MSAVPFGMLSSASTPTTERGTRQLPELGSRQAAAQAHRRNRARLHGAAPKLVVVRPPRLEREADDNLVIDMPAPKVLMLCRHVDRERV